VYAISIGIKLYKKAAKRERENVDVAKEYVINKAKSPFLLTNEKRMLVSK
jgi:hypothetical protein